MSGLLSGKDETALVDIITDADGPLVEPAELLSAVEAIVTRAVNEALTQAADAIDHRRYRRKSDWRIGLGELDIYIDAAQIVRTRTN